LEGGPAGLYAEAVGPLRAWCHYGALRLIALWPTVGGWLVRVDEIADLTRLQIWLCAGKCARRIGASDLVGRQAALAGALVDDPPAEKLGRGRHLPAVAKGCCRNQGCGPGQPMLVRMLIGRNAPGIEGCSEPKRRHTMDFTS